MPLNPLSRSETAVRLPAPADFHARLLASPVGRLVTRPWFDRVALKLGLGAYLPLSPRLGRRDRLRRLARPLP